MKIEELIAAQKGAIVDVRSQMEFSGGSAQGSINIPLQEIPSRMEELKQLPQPLILCCASGNRSGQATNYLLAQGLECLNGGSWLDVNYYQTQTN